jgi:hypothetical protein
MARRVRPTTRGVPAPAPASRDGAAGQERCELCAEPLPPAHRHLLDLRADAVACACRTCTLLFDQREAGGGRYRLLPERRLRLDGLDLDGRRWAALGVPVGLAFFVRRSADGGATACYPSALGTLRAGVDAAAWADVQQANPVLTGMADDVEALLADRTGDASRHWLLPLDDCYRLSAVLRTRWQGLSGGPDVRRHLEDFFTELSARCERS